MAWIDMHCHFPLIEETPKQIIDDACQNDVQNMITIGTHPDDLQKSLEIAKKFFPKVACTLGLHPHEANKYTLEIEEFICKNAIEPEVVAIGEIGLDYYYEHSPRDVQKKVFETQLNIAESLNLPVQIHTRDAEEDTIAILQNFQGKIRGDLHCFTGTQNLANKALDLGLDISFSGIITFKNAKDLQQVALSLPLDRIHIETDAPFLTPMPHRGKKNAPSFLVHTGQFLAQLKQVAIPKLQNQLKYNASKTFPKLSLQ